MSSLLWTSTQWPDTGTLRYTEMLDVIRDTGFDGFRLTGWPAVLSRIGMDLAQLEREALQQIGQLKVELDFLKKRAGLID